MSKAKIKSEVEQAIAKCRAHLGDVVGYSISVGRAGVDPEEFAESFIREGLPQQWLPRKTQRETAFRRAIGDAKRTFGDRTFTKMADESAALVWGISEPSDGENVGDVTARLVNQLMFLRVDVDDTGPGTVLAKVEDEVSDFVHAAYQHHQNHMDRTDIVAIVRRCLSRWRAIPLAGWAQFFVGPEHAEGVRALQKVISGLGASAFDVLPLPKVAEAQKAIGSAARLALSTEIATLKERVRKWSDGETGFMTKSLAKRLEDAAQLRERVTKLKALTKATTKDLEQELDTLTAAVTDLIKGDNNAA